jgi:hypothetical protein
MSICGLRLDRASIRSGQANGRVTFAIRRIVELKKKVLMIWPDEEFIVMLLGSTGLTKISNSITQIYTHNT